MNSANLIESNKHIYKDFFNRYDLIISTPLQFPIIWDTSIYSQWNNAYISQKLTFRNYIWINFTSSNNPIKFIYQKEWVFEESNIELFYPIDRHLMQKIWLDYDIWILSEYNWIDPASMILNILLAKLISDWEIQTQDFDKLDIENPDNQEILRHIIELDQKLMQEKWFFSILRNNSNFTLWNLLKSRSHMLVLEKNYNTSILNIWNNHNFNQMDLTISLLNPNTFVERNYNPKILIEKNKSIEKYILENWIIDKNSEDINLLNWIEIISNHYAIKTFQNLNLLYENILQTNFFNDLYSYRQSIRSIFCDFNNIKLDIRQLKNTITNAIWDLNSKIYIDLVWVSWSVRLVIFTNKTWVINQDLLKTVNQKLWTYLTLDYSSYYDWFETHWSKLEQFKSKWIISNLASGSTLTTFINWWKLVITSEYDDIKNTQWIILDKINKKIFINWEKLTSSQIHSQSFTIEMLEILVENIGEYIDNKQLPIWAYSKNKNELIGKIILPLVRLIENKLWKKLPLSCTWSLWEYLIKLDPNDIQIQIIDNKKISTQ